MNVRVALLVGLAACALAAEPADPQAAADERYVTGLDAYQRAVAADGLGRGDDARALLQEARAALDAAIAGYRLVLARDPGREAAQRRMLDAAAVGRPCCGRRSLFVAYGVPVAR